MACGEFCGAKSKGSIILGRAWTLMKTNFSDNGPIKLVLSLFGKNEAINLSMPKLEKPAKI